MKKVLRYALLLIHVFGMVNLIQAQTVKKGIVRGGKLEVYNERAGKGDALLLLLAGFIGSQHVVAAGKEFIGLL